jgi:putative hemolysin
MSPELHRSDLTPDTQTRAADYPLHADALPPGALTAGRYLLRFAASAQDLRAVQRLRFEVFNLELGEGLDSSFETGRDEDRFDATCHHLMVLDRASGQVVGTYRLMIREMAEAQGGFYSEGEYDFDALPSAIAAGGVEVGRACVHPEHRNGRVILLLWRGLARYMDHNRKRYLFGCCSLPTVDEAEAQRTLRALEAGGRMHPHFRLPAAPALRCGDATDPCHPTEVELPPLFQGYLKLGALVCSEPAVDHAFKVIDFFVVLDVDSMDPRVRRTFFESSGWSLANAA